MKKLKVKKVEKELLRVPMDQTGKLANEYLDILAEIHDLGESRDVKQAELAEVMQASGRPKIRVRGVTLKLNRIDAKVKISILKRDEQ